MTRPECLTLRDTFPYTVQRSTPDIYETLGLRGKFYGELYRKDELIERIEFSNLVMTAAKDYMFNAGFNAASQISNWYLGLIDAGTFSAIAGTNTMASHSGWTEFTNYTEAVRQAWTKGTSVLATITGATVASFTIGTGGGTLAGGFVASSSALNATSGTLWSAGQFGAAVPVVAGDVFRLNYSLSG